VFVQPLASHDTYSQIIQNSKNKYKKKVFKIIKKSNKKVSQIVFHKELRNSDSPFTWRYVWAIINPRRALKNQKIIFVFLYILLLLFLGKIKYFENHITFAHLIKGIVLWRTMWGVNIFPTRNRLLDPKYFFLHILSYLFVFFVVFQNKVWWRLQSLFLQI